MKKSKDSVSPRKQPNQDRAKETVETIFQATAHILEQEGFDKASTNKIAEKAGISIGSLYQYFPSKEAILAKMIDMFIEKEIRMLEKAIDSDTPKNLQETIETIVEAVIDGKKKQTRFTKLFAQKFLSLAKEDSMKKMDKHVLALFRTHLEKYKDEIRTENIDLSLYILYQTVRIVPVAIIFDNAFSLNDKNLKNELVYLCYNFLKKPV
jgi:AcrR family transcriptional regulator